MDLRIAENCINATKGMDHVFHLAANMGGIGPYHSIIKNGYTHTKNALLNILNKGYDQLFIDLSTFIESPNSLYLPNNTRILIKKMVDEELIESESVNNDSGVEILQRGVNRRKKLKDNVKDNLMNPSKE